MNTPEQAKELERQALEKNPVTKLSPEQAQAINEQSKPTVNTPEQAKELEDKILGNNAVQNYSKEIDIFDESKLTHQSEITVQDIKDNLQKSKIGQEIAEYSKNLKEPIELNDTTIMLDSEGRKIYGEEDGGIITINLLNCENPERAARTIIHECTHYRYGIGESQWAESVCFAQELKHKYKRDYLTISEKRRIIKAVKEGYPEYNWRKGGRFMANKVGITDKISFLFEKAKAGHCSYDEMQQIKEYTVQHSNDMIIGRFFGYSVSDYAIASLKWINTTESLSLFNEVFSPLSDNRKKEINELIEKKLYLQV